VEMIERVSGFGAAALREELRGAAYGPGAHDWWNAGDEEAHMIVEISPGARFEEAIANAFGLAQDGKTNSKGLPNLLQLALFAREFEDVMYLTRPPRIVRKVLFGTLTPVARLLGYRGSYPEYLNREPSERVQVEPWPRPGEPAAQRR